MKRSCSWYKGVLLAVILSHWLGALLFMPQSLKVQASTQSGPKRSSGTFTDHYGPDAQQIHAQTAPSYQKAAVQGNAAAMQYLDVLNQRMAATPQSSAGTAPTPGTKTTSTQQPAGTATATPSNQPGGEDENAEANSPCDLPKNSNEGLAIISATMPARDNHAGFPLLFRYTYRPEHGGWLKNNHIVLGYGRKDRGDFSQVFGELYLLRLPAGAYEFQSWEYSPFGFNGTRQPIGIHPLTFDVEDGRAVYLAGFDPIVKTGRNLLHTKVDEAWVLVHDDRTRDLPAFFGKCTAFDPKLLEVRVIDTTQWLPTQKK